MKSDYLLFDRYDAGNGDAPIYGIRDADSLDMLGVVYLYPPKQEYVFEAINGKTFNQVMLIDLAKLVQEAQSELYGEEEK